MKIALLHTPYYYQEYMENLEFVSNNFGTFPPLGMMYVSSILKEKGHKTKIIDVKAEDLSREKIIKKIKKFDPDLLGIMLIPYTAAIALDWAKYIKNKLKLPIIVGNYGMIHYPKAILSHDFIDYGIIGSARVVLPELLEHLEENNKDFENMSGLAFKKDGEIIVNYPDQITEDLNKLPWPDRDGINNNLYYSMASKKRPFTILITSYGCMYNCDFCDMGRFGYSERTPKDVVDEIEHCIEEHGVKEIDIFDRDFLINKSRSKRICEEIIKRGIKIQWSCRTRVDAVNRSLLKLMKKAGCRLVMYGIESGNQEILDKEHKGITLEEIRNAINLTKEIGIETLGFFIIGHPGESIKEIKQTIQFSKELPLDYAQFFRMSGKPGAKLYEEMKKELSYDYFEELIKGNVPVKDISRPWTSLSNEEINKWVFRAYREFYLRPSYILKKLGKIRSLNEFFKNARVGLKILIS